mgnify:CR=1 FL=1
MEERQNVGIIVLMVILVIIIGVLAGYIVYDKSIKSKSNDVKNTTGEVINQDEKKEKENIPLEDRYALDIEATLMGDNEMKLLVFFLDDGNLYYKFDNLSYSEILSYQTVDLPNSNMEKNLVKFDGLSNIKRIKGANTVSSGTDFNLLAITEDGKVYTIFINDNEVEARQNNDFDGYDVDNILKYETSACIEGHEDWCKVSFDITLNDGTSVSK